ncbi:MAG: TIGR04086 family membrane protein [Lachnospiraceae bacterium]|nr:TIGR04086 family membrane protein [Lachnospiraceae bacterium]
MSTSSIGRYIFLLKTLLFSYIMTGGLLLLLAFMLYQFKLQETIVSIGIIFIYIISTFLAGFITGKKFGEKKFIWGLVVGSAYFIILLIVSLCVNQGVADIANDLFTTFLMCAGSGMLGGMLS